MNGKIHQNKKGFISYSLFHLFTGAGLCSDFLLPTIPDSHLAASSSLNIAGSNGYTGPDRARLDTKQTTLGNTTILMGGWAPGSDNKGQYIQVSVDHPWKYYTFNGWMGIWLRQKRLIYTGKCKPPLEILQY